MWNFAWRNLLTRPLRTALALIGLSIPILGIVGLLCLSNGLRSLIGATLSQIQGVIVLRDGAFSPVFSHLPADLEAKIRAIPGIRSVAAELWDASVTIEGKSVLSQAIGSIGKSRSQNIQSLLDTPVIQGQDIAAHQGLKSAVFPRAMVKGRFLDLADRGRPHVVISTRAARLYPDAKTGRPKELGDSIRIDNKPFTIIGMYETGSIFLDAVFLMDIGVARELTHQGPDTVSSFYVEADDPSRNEAITQQIEKIGPGVDARSMEEIQVGFGSLMGQLDKFLLAIVSLTLAVGVIGIINTMLMSTTERFGEFGVLRTNGWSRGNVVTMVTTESGYLGLLAGLAGCALALLAAALANPFLRETGVKLQVTPGLMALGLGLSVLMGVLGGLYPAWRASRLVPMDAIRLGVR